MPRSPIVEDVCPEEAGDYSDLKVMRSAAGYYIGTSYNDPDMGPVPGSRDSGYYPTEEAAQADLDNDAFNQRLHP
jgi:hypothetical protein|tara:strand:+ start:718 stop:942 length:225 start_codon:yes stop_codon:yes gene_type:complete